MILLWLFIAGASVGSFLNVCIWRLPRGESIVAPPSHCPKCDRQLQALDLVPLLSQLFLRSQCRYCGARISWRYFGIELLTAILWVLVGLWAGPFGIDEVSGTWTGDWLRLSQGMVFVSCLVVIFWVDYDTRLIQLEAVFLLALAGVATDLWRTTHNQQLLSGGGFWPGHTLLPSPLPGSLWAMVVISTLLWSVREVFSWLYGKEALGFGDVILAGAIAANLGWNGTLWTFSFCSVVVGALVGVLLQIPRAMRAYRWAKKRELKYFERATEAEASALPASGIPLATSTENSSGASESAWYGISGISPNSADQNGLSLETAAQSAGDDRINSDSTSVPEEARESTNAEPPVEKVVEKVSDRERGEHWRSLAGSLARHAFRKAIPFGPMLAIGATLALLYGEPLNRAYLNWLGNPTLAETSLPYAPMENVSQTPQM